MRGYYAIIGFESVYGGLHGMFNQYICLCDSREDAANRVDELAQEVYYDFCEDEYPYEELEPDGEAVFIGKKSDFTDEQIRELDEQMYQEGFEIFTAKYRKV